MTNQRFTNRVALVTGGATGIGYATARQLIDDGATVVIASRDVVAGKRALADLGSRADFVRTDVTDPQDLTALFDHIRADHGRLDHAFNNAGGPIAFGLHADVDPDTWAADIALNLTSVATTLQHEIAIMTQQETGGSIVNNASNLGLVGIGGGVSAYVAAKHGVVGLTKAVGLEYATSGIRVNAVASGGVDTPLFRNTMGATPEGREHITSLHPIGRVAQPDEIANVVSFLLSDEASFVTATTVTADGGWTAH